MAPTLRRTRELSRTARRFTKTVSNSQNGNDVEKVIEQAIGDLLKTYFEQTYGIENGGVYQVDYNAPVYTDGVVTLRRVRDDLFHDGSLDEDGVSLESLPHEFSILVEAKRDLNLSGTEGKVDRSKVLSQVVYYLHNLRASGEVLPSVTVVVDFDEAFAIPTKLLRKYVDDVTFDWTIPASSAATSNTALLEALLNDHNITPYVENLREETFDPLAFCDRVRAYAIERDEFSKLKVDTHTLQKAFLEFQRKVFGGQVMNDDVKVDGLGEGSRKKLSGTAVQMSIFIKSLLGDETIYLHPKQKNCILIEYKDAKGETKFTKYPPSDRFTFDSDEYDLFFTKYDRAGYSFAEKKAITELADTLLEDFDRRFHGDFWTPKIWVDEAHRLIERQLGDDWKDNYVVWDAACGAKNLTRDYRFKELYCSTLHQEELNIAEDYNPEATTFQYDFLNDDMEIHSEMEGLFSNKSVSEMTVEEKQEFLKEQQGRWKLPDTLVEALVLNKPIVFFMNPPYGQARNLDGDYKEGISYSKISESMKIDGSGHASSELYTQFIYRVQMLAETFNYTNDYHFFFFNKGFLTSPSFAKFTDKLCREFRYREGFMLNAGEFSGTSSAWGIVFSGWSILKTDKPQKEFKFDVKKTTENSAIQTTSEWIAKEPPVKTITDFVPKDYSQRIATGFPATKNGFEASKSLLRGKVSLSSFGYLHNNGYNIQYSDKFTGFYSMCFNAGQGIPVDAKNFKESNVVFAVRKSWLQIISDQKLLWVRDKDVFPAPSDEFQASEDWQEFSNDCVVYSLFASGSNQTSLRDYEYGINPDGTSKKWRVENQFFWRSRETVEKLAVKHKLLEVEKDLSTDNDRYVYEYLKKRELSVESKRLLEVANKVHDASFKYRKDFDREWPKYNVLAWDAGWLQVYKMCFSRDAFFAAKNDAELQKLYDEFKLALRALGGKIAYRYSEDTGF